MCNHTQFTIGCEGCGEKLQAQIKSDYEKLMVKWNALPVKEQARIMADIEANALDYGEMMGGEPENRCPDCRSRMLKTETGNYCHACNQTFPFNYDPDRAWVTKWRNPFFATEALMEHISEMQNKGLEPTDIRWERKDDGVNGEMWHVTVYW